MVPAQVMTITNDLIARIGAATERYGPFASTHEALGVAAEEWDELREAIRANDLDAIRSEALDLAAVMMRLASSCESAMVADTGFGRRSRK
jgi:NTP pyrophosphatase (non-canonical NTP hydrolase)